MALKMFPVGPPHLCSHTGGLLKVGAMIHGLRNPGQGIQQELHRYSCSRKKAVVVAWLCCSGRGAWAASPLGSVFLRLMLGKFSLPDYLSTSPGGRGGRGLGLGCEVGNVSLGGKHRFYMSIVLCLVSGPSSDWEFPK